SIAKTSERESGGFNLIGASGIPISNWSAGFAAYQNDTKSTNISEPTRWLSQGRIQVAATSNFAGRLYNTTFLGLPSDWTPGYDFQALDASYPNAAAAWAADQAKPVLTTVVGSV